MRIETITLNEDGAKDYLEFDAFRITCKELTIGAIRAVLGKAIPLLSDTTTDMMTLFEKNLPTAITLIEGYGIISISPVNEGGVHPTIEDLGISDLLKVKDLFFEANEAFFTETLPMFGGIESLMATEATNPEPQKPSKKS